MVAAAQLGRFRRLFSLVIVIVLAIALVYFVQNR